MNAPLAFHPDSNQWLPIGADALNVKNFGAVGNGTTDDTVAMKAGIAAAREEALPLFFPPGRYRATGLLTQSGQTGPLEIFGPNATILHDFANLAGWPLFLHSGGSLGSPVLLTANATVGDQQITVASGAGFAAKDFIVLRNSAMKLYGTSAGEIGSVEGEVLRIESVSGNVLHLITSLEEVYTLVTDGTWTNNNIDVRKINLISGIHLHDINFEDISSDVPVIPGVSNEARVVQMSCMLEPKIRNCFIKGFSASAFRLDYAIDFRIEDCTFEDLSYEAGYGLNIMTGSSGLFLNPIMRNGRHCMTTGGSPDDIPPRHVDCINGRAYGNIAAAFDTHPIGKYIRFINCEDYSHRALGGTGGDASFQIRCQHVHLINPRVTGGGHDYGIAVYNGAVSTVITGGEIRGALIGIYLDTCENVSISDINIFTAPNATDGIRIERETVLSYQMSRCHISNISIVGSSLGTPLVNGINYAGATWQDAFTLDIDLIRIRNCTNKVVGANMQLNIAPNQALSYPIGGTQTSGLIMIWCTATPTAGAAPSGLLRYRVGSSPNISNCGMADMTNIVLTTGVLTGTTGIAGNFTISAHTDGTLYFENRTAVIRTIGMRLLGPA